MIRLLRYFKPYLVNVVLVIGLLFAQANADLALPDYMSRIVNVGIQQGGITDSVPAAVRQSRMDMLMSLMTVEQRALVMGAYTLLTPDSAGYADSAARYPGAAGQNFYTIASISEETRVQLDSAIEGALAAAMAMRGMADPDPLLLEQAGIQSVREEYIALGVDMGRIQTAYILSSGGWMLLLTLASVIATILVGFLGSRAAAGVARDLRRDVFTTVEGFSFAEMDKFSTASLITRSTNDITQVQMVSMMGLRMVFYAPIIGIGGVIRATAKASSMWWIIALAVSILVVIIAAVFIIALPRFKSIQKRIDQLNLVVRENLSGMMVIRAFNMQAHESARFDKANKDLTSTMLFVTRVMVVLMPVIMLLMNLVSLLIIWTGAHEVAQSQIRVGDMMAFMQYSMQIFFAFIMLSMMFIILPRASVSADRIQEVLSTRTSIKDAEKTKALSADLLGRVEFKEVTFRYPGSSEDVLHKISFVAKPGETTAILGTTGAGKSTLVSLIPRFYDVTEGSVSIDGIDVRDLNQKELREKIGFVPQKTSLFSGSIKSNLLYAREDASAEDISRALEISQAREFVDSKPEGADAELSQGGTNVSGGQRQRLTIARALVKNAPICIFDDSFSALDYTTDMKLRQALRSSLRDSTILLVTQRVATIRNADQIIVLDEGSMVGKGSHHELMETCEVYRDIALSQLKQEELA